MSKFDRCKHCLSTNPSSGWVGKSRSLCLDCAGKRIGATTFRFRAHMAGFIAICAFGSDVGDRRLTVNDSFSNVVDKSVVC